MWEERVNSAVRGIGVICQVTDASRRNRVGGTRSVQLIGLAWSAVSCLAPGPFEIEKARGLLHSQKESEKQRIGNLLLKFFLLKFC